MRILLPAEERHARGSLTPEGQPHMTGSQCRYDFACHYRSLLDDARCLGGERVDFEIDTGTPACCYFCNSNEKNLSENCRALPVRDKRIKDCVTV